VLVMGGFGRHVSQNGSSNADLNTAEIFDPGTNRWYPAGKMLKARKNHTAFLDGGKVIVVGPNFQEVEMLDVATFRWRQGPTKLSSIVTSWTDCVAVQAGGAPWLLVGGDGTSNFQTELFIHASDEFSAGGLTGVFELQAGTTGSTLKYKTPSITSYTSNTNSGLKVIPVAAEASSTPGPFVFDPESGAAVTSIDTTSTDDLFEGQQYAIHCRRRVLDGETVPPQPAARPARCSA